MAADSVGESFDGGAEMADFGGEAGERARVVAAVAVFFDDSTEFGVAVEGGATGPGAFGDRGECDRHAGGGEFATDCFDVGGAGGHPV